MELYNSSSNLLEELEMEYYTNINQDFNIAAAWNDDHHFSMIPTNTNTCFHDNYSDPPCFDQPPLNCSSFYSAPFGNDLGFSPDSSYTNFDSQTPPNSQPQHINYYINPYPASSSSIFQDDLDIGAPCKPEPVPTFNMGFSHAHEVRNMTKSANKLNGQPSKNLMAERRRRKRLNDRLSMLRSIVPKISKMDRTSILGDTIDYMKELLHSINKLQEEMTSIGANDEELGLLSIFKNAKPQQILIRNTPKFEVEMRSNSSNSCTSETETKIEICCGAKSGLLLSTVTTLEALGLDIEHCVISCFNDFSMQASCSQDLKQRGVLDSEDIKQALFRNAGYGGRCL